MPRPNKIVNRSIRTSTPKRSNQQRVRLLVLEDRTTPVTFDDPISYPAESNASHLATADLDGDGDLDVVYTSISGVNVLINDGKGELSNPVTMGAGGTFTNKVIIADVNGDGKLDLSVGVSSAHVAIYRGNGNGSFQAPVIRDTGTDVQNLTVADFNGDSKADIAIVTKNQGMGILLNDGSAKIVGLPTFYLPDAMTSDAVSIATADFSSDDIPDLAYIDYDPSGNQRKTVFIGKGDGTFSTTGPELTGSTLRLFATQVLTKNSEGKTLDFNNDGKADLAIGYGSSGFVGIFLGNGNGTFQPQNTYSTNNPLAGFLSAADFDQDGNVDVSITALNGSKVGISVFLGDGNGSLGLPTLVPTFFNQESVLAADLDQDGYPDLLTTNSLSPSTLSVFFNTSNVAPQIASFDVVPVFGTVLAGMTQAVTVTAHDQTGALYKGYTGTVHFSSSDGLGILPPDYTFVAGDQGQHTFPAITLKTAGNQTVTVQDTTLSSATGSKSISVTPAQPATISTISGVGQSATVNTGFAAPLIAKVTDAFGNAVPGVSVTFTAPTGSASASFPSGSTVATNAAGQVSLLPLANTIAGGYTITASVGGVPTTASFALSNTPGTPSGIVSVSGSGQSATVNTAFVAPLIAKVSDAFGNAVPGVAVTFAGPLTGPGVTFSGSPIQLTDGTGQVSISASANTKASTFNVSATIAGGTTPTLFNLTNLPGSIASFVAESGGNQSAKLNQTFASPLVVRVADSFGNPIPNITVSFASPNAGAGVTFPGGSTAVSDATGTATVQATANGYAGTYTVVASVSEVASPANFALTNVNTAGPNLIGFPEFSVGSKSSVNFYNPDGTLRSTITPFGSLTGGLRTAAADFNSDGIADLVVGTGPGGPTHVKVFNGVTLAEIFSVDPFEATFKGGVYVAAGDLNGDGVADLAITPDEGGGPRVRVFTGAGFTQIADFFGIDDKAFRGGARAAIGDLNGDGKGDLVVAAGFRGGPRVAAFDGAQLQSNGGPKLFNDFYAFEQTLRNGIFVAAGDVNGDGFGDLVAGGGPGGGPRVFILDGKRLVQNGSDTLVPVGNFFAGNPANRGGIRVAVKNLDNDAKADLITGAGTGAGSRVTAYLGANITPIGGTPAAALDFDAFPGFTGGVFVG